MEVDIGTETYSVYTDVDEADLYMGAAFHGSTWRASTTDNKAMALVTATRTLDRQLWRGDKTDDAQELQWPRKNTGIKGVTDSVVPVAVKAATIEMALALLDGSDVQNQQSTAERVRTITAGSVSITNFRGVDIVVRFPQIIQELLGPYLASGVPVFGGAKATGTDGQSVLDQNLGFNRGI